MITMDVARKPSRILCLGAHSDDIEIGCGGTILRLLSLNRDLTVYWVVFAAAGEREAEARRSANLFLQGAAERSVRVQGFRDGFFPYQGEQIKEYVETLKSDISPDLIFTHYRHDAHQDHRLLAELTWNTFRDHLILEYEIPKYDGDMGQPNAFMHLDDVICRSKVQYLLGSFTSQSGKHWFSEDLFFAMLRLRGMEAHSPTGYAEAFHCRKLAL